MHNAHCTYSRMNIESIIAYTQTVGTIVYASKLLWRTLTSTSNVCLTMGEITCQGILRFNSLQHFLSIRFTVIK